MTPSYFAPQSSPWPILAMLAILTLFIGLVLKINSIGFGDPLIGVGLAALLYLLYSWFSDILEEAHRGLYSEQVLNSFKQGMIWFLVSELLVFVGMISTLLYVRFVDMPWLSGQGYLGVTKEFLHYNFAPHWPPAGPGRVSGSLALFATISIVLSVVALSLTRKKLERQERAALAVGLYAAVGFGALFIILQLLGYYAAHSSLDLTLKSGIYASTFYLFTGIQTLYIAVGLVMLSVLLIRTIKGHFAATAPQAAFTVVSWYWCAVGIQWVAMFILVYLL